MIILGLLVLLVVGGLAVSRITARGGAHSPAGPGRPGYHPPGPGSGLFFCILALAAAAASALVRMRRRRAAR
jgi:MYXO-CTERM domain-containing protein